MRDKVPAAAPTKPPELVSEHGAGQKPNRPTRQPELVSEHGTGQHANKPRFQGHDAPPDPILRHLGFVGSILDFNDHVEAIAAAHQQTFGYLPPPGLTLDVARSSVGIDDYQKLFPFRDQRTRLASETWGKYATDNPHDLLTPRADGVLTRPYPTLISEHGLGQDANKQPPGLAQLKKKYPNVQMGMLPIPGAENVYTALAYLNTKGGLQTAVTQQGMSLPQFEEEVKRGRGIAPDLAANADMTMRLQQRQGATVENPHGTLVGAALTLKDAQKQLNRAMGTHLPESGYFTADWTDALSNWMKSASYFQKVTEQQAQDAGFGGDVGAYMKAWRGKQQAVHKNGLVAHFLNAMPLPLFGHGGVLGGVKAVPGYIVGGAKFHDPVTSGLHMLKHTAGLGLDVVGGTVQQAKGDLAAGNEFMAAILPKTLSGKGKTYEEALKEASNVLAANPSWLRILYPDLDAHPKGFLKGLDEATNIAGDLILLRKPAFTGESVAAGDLPTALNSAYLNSASLWSYRYLAAGKIEKAARMLEGGEGSQRLATIAAKLVKTGKMTSEQYAQHAAELYATGRTTIVVGGKDVPITGPVLNSLRSEKLPTPGVPGRAWLTTKNHLGDFLDSIDRSFRASDYRTGDLAASMMGSVRAAVQHAAPTGARGMFDETLPEGVANFVRKWKLGDEAAAQKFASDVVRFQAKENVVGLQNVQRKIERLYHLKYPVSERGVPSEFDALLGTEAPSVFHFPGGGSREVEGVLTGLDRARSKTSAAFNRIAKLNSRLILSTGFSLFYKHAVADFTRLVIGGGLAGRGDELNVARREIEGLAGSSPEYERRLGTFLSRATQGETRWLLGRGSLMPGAKSFQTAEKFGKANYMDAAGGNLRRLLSDDAMLAYQQSTSDLTPLVQLVLHNRTYRGMWKSARREAGRQYAQHLGVERLTPAQYADVLPAEEYAQQVAWRFKDFEDAAAAARVQDPFAQAAAVLRGNRGAKVDRALGKWIQDNGIDWLVEHPQVEQVGTFDHITGSAISAIMAPNKKYRRDFATAVLHKTFAELRKADFSPEEAFAVATSLAEKQVKYHMLDFSNRLQVEQDLRWVSYFATKHRLYWKWVLGTLLRRPGVAALATDAKQLLDEHGNVPLHVKVLGRSWSIPLERLFWIPGREYNETSPLLDAAVATVATGDLSAGFKAAGGTYGNVVSRIDTPIRLAIKLARVQAGNLPATYGTATAGMDDNTKARLNRAINEYQLSYYAEHGQYAPENEAVKHVLVAQMAEEFWRSTLPLPVVPDYQPSAEQRLVRQFMGLVDPRQRRKFLEDHPGFSDHFGIYDDPRIYLHNREMFGRYVTALDTMRAARSKIMEQARREGFTPDLLLQKRTVDSAFQATFDKLLREDARFAGHDLQESQIPGVGGVPYGPWGRLTAADPQINPKHLLNAMFPKLKATEQGKIYGALQQQLQQELRLLNSPKYAATYPDPDELKIRKGEIIQQLEVFRRLPSDALGAVYAKYTSEHVGPYWRHIEHEIDAIKKLPSAERDLAYAELRAWRDKQDQDVKINGVTFPSPARMAWATLDPATRNSRLRYFASKSWADLSSLEKELLGVKRDPKIVEGWQTFMEAYTSVSHQLHKQGDAMPSGYKLILAKDIDRKVAPGFLKDFLFSLKPTYERLPLLKIVRDSKYRTDWHDLLTVARSYAAYLKSGDYSSTSVRETWREWLQSPSFLNEFHSTPKGFQDEVADYGPDFLNTLISP